MTKTFHEVTDNKHLLGSNAKIQDVRVFVAIKNGGSSISRTKGAAVRYIKQFCTSLHRQGVVVKSIESHGFLGYQERDGSSFYTYKFIIKNS